MLPPSSPSPSIQTVVDNQQTELSGVNHDIERNATPRQIPSTLKITTNANPLVDKTLSGAANLVQLLPTGTVLAFEALSSSFTNNGKCYVSNKYLTALLIYFCVLSCVFLTFTDSLVGQDGKLYYGLATFRGFYVFNFCGSDDEAARTFNDLYKLRIRIIDLVHAFFGAIVFLAVAFSDTGVQSCYFHNADHDSKELLINLPLGAAFLSSFVFLVFPTTRKGIGYANVSH